MNIISILKLTPFFPHWLEFRQYGKLELRLIDNLYGQVLEVGCGNGELKRLSKKYNNKITNYLATDYFSWDDLFMQQQKSEQLALGSGLFGKVKKVQNIDKVANATNLDFDNASFDCHVSSEVIEHIDDIDKYFSEAYRVLKNDSLLIIKAPYLYREHPNDTYDYRRISRGGYKYLAKKHGFKVVSIYSNIFFGGTICTLTNQYIIRKIMESNNYLLKSVLFLLSPIIFFTSNVLGFLLDSFDRDYRFSTNYLVVMRKLS